MSVPLPDVKAECVPGSTGLALGSLAVALAVLWLFWVVAASVGS
jgi:hypothetical protein